MSDPKTALWFTQSIEETASHLATDLYKGLDGQEVDRRLEQHGSNVLEEGTQTTFLQILIRQFMDVMILVLFAAALISGLMGEWVDTIVILIIVVLNAMIGTFQEYRAENALAVLKKRSAPDARVRRNGEAHTIPADGLVPGDIVLLEAGNIVPADLRLFELADLEIDESALTGESLAVEKSMHALEDDKLTVGDRINMAYKGTNVTRGRAAGIVVTTGMQTQLGKIASLLKSSEMPMTPLQQRLARFGKRLTLAILLIAGVVFVAGLGRGEPFMLMLLTAISLAVAAIPEALPAVVTIALALGAKTMSKKNALIRRLPAVETLGSVTFICSDKTGTLTRNEMFLEALYADGCEMKSLAELPHDSELKRCIGRSLALSTDVTLDEAGQPVGDPTETALYEAALRAEFNKFDLEQEFPRLAEVAFSADRRAMSTLHRQDHEILVLTKGAPEAILPLCTQQMTSQGYVPLNPSELEQQAENMAGEGYRVLALACRYLPELPEQVLSHEVETDLVLLGLIGLIDPPREEAREAVQDCKTAGITPVMITGDHPGTARAIAKRLGILNSAGEVMTGVELDRLSDEEFQKRVRDIEVYARVSPRQKIRIVNALQDVGEFVSMTGDGVNDAPALKRANIGIAMGNKGTDVAREASSMVLVDDNFATIVRAVREGRRIFDNIRKFIKYTMTSNSGEIWVLFLAPFLGLPLPLLPIQILWINLVTDGLPGLALSIEGQEKGIMKRSPRRPDESIFAGGMWQHMIWVGLLIGGLSLGAQAWAYFGGSDNWQTMVFTTLTLSQLVHATVIRSERESLFTLGLFSNMSLLGAVLLTVGLQMVVIYVPFFNEIFHTSPLNMQELAICFALPLVVFVAVEIEKLLVRRGVIYQHKNVLGAQHL